MRHWSTVMAMLASLGAPLLGAPSALAAGGYATSNAGIANVQASTAPVTRACPAAADWLRDPNVCARRWSATSNDKSESDLQVDPTNPNHLVGLSKVFWSPHDYLFDLEWYESEDGGKTWSTGELPGYDSAPAGEVQTVG